MEPIVSWIVLHGQNNILLDRQFSDEPQILKGSANPLPIDGVGLLVRQIFPPEDNLAALWLDEVGNEVNYINTANRFTPPNFNKSNFLSWLPTYRSSGAETHRLFLGSGSQGSESTPQSRCFMYWHND